MTQEAFKISTGLKDLIGQDLITDDFVAVFELVKNAFDAHARKVNLLFEADRIVIADDGKGMSRANILNKWLFVAYSAKRDGTEDDDYRNRVGQRTRHFAGAKGVGRFSCDRLGTTLRLASKAADHPVQILDIDWKNYEGNPKTEFSEVEVGLSRKAEFPDASLKPGGETGTVLEIRDLRYQWNRDKLQRLKRELTKLIDPFSSGTPKFQINISAPGEVEADELDAAYNASLSNDKKPSRLIVNGVIENPILDVIGNRTASIQIRLTQNGRSIETTLEDRGETIYRIREPNEYSYLGPTAIKADIYFLNRSAKAVFGRRMGIPSVQFGSIFLFRNGFRVFPIGAEDDDFFGLNRRKAQGQRRFLGNRDLIGRVDIQGAAGFNEATSRQGLIRNEKVQELIDCVRDKCVRRLERYVVDITWKDKFDTDQADISRIMLDESSALVTQLVSRLAATEGVELLEYNPELVRIIDEKSSAFEASLDALELLAEETGDKKLLARVEDAKARIRALEAAEAEAREAESRAQSRAMAAEAAAEQAEQKFTDERERNAFLVAASSLDQDTVLNLHHQIMGHATDVQHGVKRMMGKLRSGAQITKSDWIDFLERVSYRNGQIIIAAKFATKGGYKQQSAQIEADLAGYIKDYVETIGSLWAPRGITVSVTSDDKEFRKLFKPIEIGMILDNLVSNATKAKADNINIAITVGKGQKPELLVDVSDDGIGWPKSFSDVSRVFEKGVTTTDGSGLGLFHVKQLVEGMKGVVGATREPFSASLNGAHIILRVPS
ncbi:MAG TPA: ATP-binding protein [Rhizomicrobium sp.]